MERRSATLGKSLCARGDHQLRERLIMGCFKSEVARAGAVHSIVPVSRAEEGL